MKPYEFIELNQQEIFNVAGGINQQAVNRRAIICITTLLLALNLLKSFYPTTRSKNQEFDICTHDINKDLYVGGYFCGPPYRI